MGATAVGRALGTYVPDKEDVDDINCEAALGTSCHIVDMEEIQKHLDRAGHWYCQDCSNNGPEFDKYQANIKVWQGSKLREFEVLLSRLAESDKKFRANDANTTQLIGLSMESIDKLEEARHFFKLMRKDPLGQIVPTKDRDVFLSSVVGQPHHTYGGPSGQNATKAVFFGDKKCTVCDPALKSYFVNVLFSAFVLDRITLALKSDTPMHSTYTYKRHQEVYCPT